jgi:thiosulfate/3-mercaptopyruvate sulfurtransferase
VRWYLDGRSGRAAFEAGHIPGAIYVDLDTDLTADRGGFRGRHPLPSAAQFAATLGRLGIGPGTPVVAYDDSGGGSAGRLVWMLRTIGHPAALLDGGLKAWAGSQETGAGRTVEPVEHPAVEWPATATVEADEVATSAESGDAIVLDARSAERFRGETEPVDARAGHIPGAGNAHWQGNLDPATGRFLDPEALRARFERLGVTDGHTVIAYCGSGVSACANLLALEAAGLPGGRLYVASWSGWSADPDRPVATDD